jgi:hypothetical protein
MESSLEGLEALAKILVGLIAFATFIVSFLSVVFGRRLAAVEKWQQIHDRPLMLEGQWRGEVTTRLSHIEKQLDKIRSCPHPECPVLGHQTKKEE